MRRTSALTCGVDVGGSKILAVAVDLAEPPAPLAIERAPTPRGGDEIVEAVAEVVGRLRATVEPEHGEVGALGVGVAGLVDRSGTLCYGPNLPGAVDVAFASRLEDALSLPVAVDNDATAAACGEHRWGAARGASDAVVVTLGTGIGGGIVADGRIRRGANAFAAEVGHMVIVPDGPPCPCGGRGCWERYASGSALARLAREAAAAGRADGVVALAGGAPEDVRGEHVTAAAAGGDEGAMALFEEYGRWVALGLANLADILDPEVVVLGGGLVEADEHFLEPTRRWFGRFVLAADHRPEVRIVPAELGELAPALGAALLPGEAVE